MATKKGSKAVKVATVEATNPADEVMQQLATRIPKPLHKALKTHCVSTDQTVGDFVIASIEDRLAAETQPAKKARK